EAVVGAVAVVGVDEDPVAAGVQPGELVVAVLRRAIAVPVRLGPCGAAGRACPQTGVGDRGARFAEHAAADRRARIDLPLEALQLLVGDLDRIVLVARLIAGAAGVDVVRAGDDAVGVQRAVGLAHEPHAAIARVVAQRSFALEARLLVGADHDLAFDMSRREHAHDRAVDVLAEPDAGRAFAAAVSVRRARARDVAAGREARDPELALRVRDVGLVAGPVAPFARRRADVRAFDRLVRRRVDDGSGE